MKSLAYRRAVLLILTLFLPGCASAQRSPVPLHVVEIGSGGLTTVVLTGIPGAAHRYLRPEWDRLTELGRVVYYDQRGCGGSVREGPHAWRQQVLDLDAVVREVGGDGPLVVAGAGWGATLALLYAYSRPGRVSALVLADLPPWLSPADYARMDAFERGFLSLEETEAWEERRESAIALSTSPRTSGDTIDSLLVASGAGGFDPGLAGRIGTACPAVARAVGYSLRSAPPLDSLRSVTAPTLLLRGAKLGLPGDAASYASVLPGSELVTLDVGRNGWLEQPEAFFDAVQRFLRERLSAR